MRRLHDYVVKDAPVIAAGKLDAAIHRPQMHDQYEPGCSFHMLAAVFFEGVAQSHSFLDGNKRAAVVATIAFYALNGWDFNPTDNELIHRAVDIVTGDANAAKAAEMFEIWAESLPVAQNDDVEGDGER